MIDRRALSPKHRAQICLRQSGRCASCNAKLRPAGFEIDHTQALEHGGDNEGDNLRALCNACHRAKTRIDHKERAKGDRVASGGRQRKGPPMPGSRASKFKRHMNGKVSIRPS